MRTLRINSETWLWTVGRHHVVIRQEDTKIKYIVPKNAIGVMWRPQCSCGPSYNCNEEVKLKRIITPKHIRAYIASHPST